MTSPPGIWAPVRPRNLIDQLTADSVASDYQVLGVDERPSRASRQQHLMIAACGLGVAGFVLAMGISNQLVQRPVVNQQREALVARVRAAEAAQDELAAELVTTRQEAEQARAEALELSATGQQVALEVTELEQAVGLVAVTGPGVVVQLDDAPEDQVSGQDADLTKVLDADVQQAVNGLWRAGAEAIAVNGQRLSARSAIRSAAGAILVNYRPLRPPYLVSAIGDADSLLARFTDTPDAQALTRVSKQFGIGFQASSTPRVELPAATAMLPEVAGVVPEVEK